MRNILNRNSLKATHSASLPKPKPWKYKLFMDLKKINLCFGDHVMEHLNQNSEIHEPVMTLG